MRFGLIFFGIATLAVNFKTSIGNMCLEYNTQFTCPGRYCDPTTGDCFLLTEGSCSLPIECTSEEQTFTSTDNCGEVTMKYYYETCALCSGGPNACVTVNTAEINNYPFGTFDEDGTYRILSAEESWWGPLHGTSQEAPVIYANRPNFLYLTVIIPIQKMNTYSADPVSALENLESDIANHMNILTSRVRVVLFIMCHRTWVRECYTISGTVPATWQSHVQATSMPSVTMVGLTSAISVDPEGEDLLPQFTRLVEDMQTDSFHFFADSSNRTHVDTLLLNYPELDSTYYTSQESSSDSAPSWIPWVVGIFCILFACCAVGFVCQNRCCSKEDEDWGRLETLRSWGTSVHSRFRESFYSAKTSVVESDTNSEQERENNKNVVAAFGIQGRKTRLTRADYQEHVSRKELRELAHEDTPGDFEHSLVPSRV